MESDNEEQFQFEAVYRKVRLKIFEAAKVYLDKSSNINPMIIYFLVLIESLQILWFSIHPLLKFEDSPLLLNYIRSALSYLNFEQTIRNNNSMLFPFLIIITSITILHITTLVFSIKNLTQVDQMKSQFYNFVHNFATIQIILFNTVLTIPIFNVSAITLYCNQDSPYHQSSSCYNSIYIVMCIFSSVNLLVLLLESLLYWFIFYLRNPFFTSYYALYSNLNKLGKLLLKILPPLYFVLDVHYNFQNVYVFMFLFLTVAYIGFFRILSIHNFCENFFYFQLFLESVIGWFFINSVICFEFPTSKMNFVQTVFCSLLCGYAVCTVESALTKNFFISNIEGLVKKQDREKFMFILINILFNDQITIDINPIVYIKLINSYLNVCNIKISKLLMKSDLKPEEMLSLSRQTMLLLLSNFMEESSTTNLKLIKFNILYDTGQRILAIHEVTELRNQKLSTYDEFLIYYFKSTKKIYQSFNIKGVEQSLIEIENYLHYIEYMNKFENELEICAINNELYWEELCQDMPSVNKIYNLAKKSLQYIKNIDEIYKKMQQIYQQNISALLLYYHFLSDVCVRYKQCTKIKEKLALERQLQRQKQLAQKDINEGMRIKYKPNEKMCVIHVSTASASIGIMVNCNSEVTKYLGYEKNELLNQKVTKIMPKIFSQIHDGFIVEYLKKADSVKLPAEKRVFALHKNLRIIETSLAVKIFPHAIHGFQLVGFFKEKNKKEDVAYLILNLKTYEVEGMSQRFIEMSGRRIKLAEIQKQPLKLSHLFPELDSNYKFKDNQQTQTLFRFSDCTDKLIQIEEISNEGQKKFQKNVTIEVDCIVHYRGADIGYLIVKEVDGIISLRDTGKMKSQINNKIKGERIKIKYDTKERKRPTEIEGYEDIMLQRRIEDFINQKSYTKQIFIVQAVFIASIIGVIVSVLSMNIYKAMNIVNPSITQEIKLAENISIIEGKILIMNQDILCQGCNLSNQKQWNFTRSHFYNEFERMEECIVTLFTKANERIPTNLVINQFIQYPFISRYQSTKLTTISNLSYIDGAIQTIIAGKSMLNNSIQAFINPVSYQVYESRAFIEDNMKSMLPQISQQTIDAYEVFNQDYHNALFINQIYFIVVKSILVILLYFAMFFMISKFAQFSRFVVKMYQNILKWDAYELYIKCRKFRTTILQSNTKENDRQSNNSNSDILKVFPKSLLVMLAQGIGKKNSLRNQKTRISGFRKKTVIENKEQEDQLIANEESLKDTAKSPDKDDLIQIQLSEKFKFENKYYTLFAFLIFVLGCSFIFLYKMHQSLEQMKDQNNNMSNMDNFTKTFLFTYYYGRKALQNSTQYLNLYQQELSQFYDVGTKVSGLMINQQHEIREVYKQIQIMNAIITDQTKSYGDEISIKLFQSTNIIQNYIEDLSNQMERDMQNHITMIRVSKSIVEVLLICLFGKLVFIFIINPVKQRIKHSINMVKMMPIWLITKNSKIIQIVKFSNTTPPPPRQLPQSQQLNRKGNKNSAIQNSTTNLIIKSRMQRQSLDDHINDHVKQ